MATAAPLMAKPPSRRAVRPASFGAMEVFVLLQFFPPALLFIPGASALRPVIRAVPYVSSLGMLAYYWLTPYRGRFPAGGILLALAMGLLTLNLFHPGTDPKAGIIHLVLQLAIAAPMFWGARAVPSQERLDRLLRLFFLGNTASAVVGLLQTYFPGHFMPPEFNNAGFAKVLTYTLSTGEKLTRPPGLSDNAGGAATAGVFIGLVGILLGCRPAQGWLSRALYFGMAAVGLFDLFLTQVRSLFMMLVVVIAAVCVLLVRQRRLGQSALTGGLTAAMVAGALVWAIAVGGESVANRYWDLLSHDPLAKYQEQRGIFLNHTFTVMLPEYPLGGGLGRWGIAAAYNSYEYYFSPVRTLNPAAEMGHGPASGGADDYGPIHAEIQLAGWLIDGGVLMWFLYGGAVLCSMVAVYRLANRTGSERLAQSANIVFGLNLLVVGQAMAGPSFNSPMGIQFWLLAAALHGAAGSLLPSAETGNRSRRGSAVTSRSRPAVTV